MDGGRISLPLFPGPHSQECGLFFILAQTPYRPTVDTYRFWANAFSASPSNRYTVHSLCGLAPAAS